MKKKLLCGMLAALMLVSSAACTNDGKTPNDTTEAPTQETTAAPTETPTETPTEEATEPEPETEPPIEITAPAYEDIGLIGKLTGEDNRQSITYDLSKYTYGTLRSDNNLVFTSNLDYTSGRDGLSITEAGWTFFPKTTEMPSFSATASSQTRRLMTITMETTITIMRIAPSAHGSTQNSITPRLAHCKRNSPIPFW